MTLYALIQVVALWGSNGLNWGQLPVPHVEQSRVVSVFPAVEECERARSAMGPQPSGIAFVCVPLAKR